MRSKFRYERRRRAFAAAQYIFLIGLLFAGAWWTYGRVSDYLFTSDHFKIKTIEVAGAKNILQSEILALLPFRIGDNMFRVNVSAAEKNLKSCKPELKDLSVSRTFQGIKVSFRERVPMAFVTVGGKKLGVDADNKPFPLRGEYVNAPLAELVAVTESERRFLIDFLSIFKPAAGELSAQVVRFRPEAVKDVSFDLADGVRVYWGAAGKGDLKGKIERLNSVLSDARSRYGQIEYANLYYYDDGRVLIKPKKGS